MYRCRTIILWKVYAAHLIARLSFGTKYWRPNKSTIVVLGPSSDQHPREKV